MKLPPPSRDSAFTKLLDHIVAGTDTPEHYQDDLDELEAHHRAHAARMEALRRDSLSDTQVLAESIDRLAQAIAGTHAAEMAAAGAAGSAVAAGLHYLLAGDSQASDGSAIAAPAKRAGAVSVFNVGKKRG